MGRPRKKQLIEEMTQTPAEGIRPDEMPLETMRDYRLYNEAARKENKRLRTCKYKIKPCPVELHPTERVVFHRNDQPLNPLPVFKSDEKIHFDKLLHPGKTYDLPKYIVHYLMTKVTKQWGQRPDANGELKPVVVGASPKFSLQTVFEHND